VRTGILHQSRPIQSTYMRSVGICLTTHLIMNGERVGCHSFLFLERGCRERFTLGNSIPARVGISEVLVVFGLWELVRMQYCHFSGCGWMC